MNSIPKNKSLPEKTLRLALLAYAWNSKGNLDAYISSFVEAFTKLGAEVDIYLANRVTEDLGIFGVNRNYDLSKFSRIAKSRQYDMALSFNNALLFSGLEEQVTFPIVTWLVDDFPHIFHHDGADKTFGPFRACSSIIVSSPEIEANARRMMPDLSERIRYMPTATAVAPDLLQRPQLPKDHNITLIASYLETGPVIRLIQDSIGKNKHYSALVSCLERLESNYQTDLDTTAKNLQLESFLKKENWPVSQLKNHLSNLLSNRERVDVAVRLQKYGLHLFGNPAWLEALALRPEIGRVFQADKKISKHHELMELYNASKICINIPQKQTGPALPYRVLDILASDSLLITKFHPHSDAYRLFGPDCPIVFYKSQQELEDLCAYYLEHEQERQELVKRCNQLVAKGFSFRERALDLVALHLPEIASKLGTQGTRLGVSRVKNMDAFLTIPGRWRKLRLSLIKGLITTFIAIALPNKIKRAKLANLILEV